MKRGSRRGGRGRNERRNQGGRDAGRRGDRHPDSPSNERPHPEKRSRRQHRRAQARDEHKAKEREARGEPGKRPKGRSRAEKKARQLVGTESSAPRGRRGERGERADRRTLTGRIQKNPKGFAFILPDDPTLPDAYVGREEAMGLLNDDTVEFVLRRRGGRASAEIRRILSRGQTELLGVIMPERKRHGAFFRASDGEVYQLSDPRAGFRLGDWVIARIQEYPSAREGGTVAIKKTLGGELTPAHDYPIAIARFSLEHEFSRAAIADAEAGRARAEEVLDDIVRGRHHDRDRRDLRALPFVTIDGPDAKDFDDAILVEKPARGPAFRLHVAIADVSFFVRVGTALDDEARRRGTSIYLPGTVIPMLPETLSNDLCSLRPQTERFALNAEIDFDEQGYVTGTRFYESVIKTARRLTYEQVSAYLAGDPAVTRDLAFLDEPLQAAYDLYQRLLQRRKERGVLDFELPECKVQVDRDGRPTACGPAPRYESHRLIEEFMIAANRAVAKALKDSGREAVYRVHEAPDEKAVQELNELLKSLGVSHRIEDVSPKAFAKILSHTQSLKFAPMLHQAILRRQKQARYEPNALGHFGLSLKDYTHFTSPIRRYPDLVVHRALKQLIYGGRQSDKDFERMPPLGEVAAQNSDSERKAMEAERWAVKRKQCWFMQERVGRTYPGRIGSVTSRGLYVEIPEYAVDGFVPLESLPGLYEFDERRQILRKRPGHHVLQVGDAFPVRVARVAIAENEIELEPVKSTTP